MKIIIINSMIENATIQFCDTSTVVADGANCGVIAREGRVGINAAADPYRRLNSGTDLHKDLGIRRSHHRTHR